MAALGLVLTAFGAAMLLHPNTTADAVVGSFMAVGGMAMIYLAYREVRD